MTKPQQQHEFGYFPRNKYKDLVFYMKTGANSNYGLFEMPDTPENREIMEALRSRPTPSPESDIFNMCWELHDEITDEHNRLSLEEICGTLEDIANASKSHDAAITAKARGDVLEKLHSSFKVTEPTGRETEFELGFRQGMTHARCEINNLRSKGFDCVFEQDDFDGSPVVSSMKWK